MELVVAGETWHENGLSFLSKVGTAFIPVSVQVDFRNALHAANLPRIRFHDLRHSAATLMLSHGVPAVVVSKILCHSSPSITLGVYAHATLEMQGQAASGMDEIVAPVAVVIPQLQPSATKRLIFKLPAPEKAQDKQKHR